jgi:hypothetical protein
VNGPRLTLSGGLMIIGKRSTSVLLYVAVVIVVLSIMLSFVWAKHHKTIVPATAPLHEKK